MDADDRYHNQQLRLAEERDESARAYWEDYYYGER